MIGRKSRSFLFPPLAASIAFLTAYSLIGGRLATGVLSFFVIGFYMLGAFFLLFITALRQFFSFSTSFLATMGVAVAVSILFAGILSTYPLNEIWYWGTWPIVLSCPLTAAVFSALELNEGI